MNYDSQDHKESLQKRFKTIKKLLEEDHEKARSNIKKKQEIQKQVQDARNNVTNEVLRPGQLVTIKSMKIQNKLEPKYNGIFEVVLEEEIMCLKTLTVKN